MRNCAQARLGNLSMQILFRQYTCRDTARLLFTEGVKYPTKNINGKIQVN